MSSSAGASSTAALVGENNTKKQMDRDGVSLVGETASGDEIEINTFLNYWYDLLPLTPSAPTTQSSGRTSFVR